MGYVWDNSPHSGSLLLLHLALADHANDDGICWPSIPRLAKRIRASERQTMRLIAQLSERGDIEIMEQGKGRGNSHVYRVKHDAGVTDSTAKHDADVTFLKNAKRDIQGTKRDTQRAKRDIQGIKRDIAMSPEPPIEPPIEPSYKKEPPLLGDMQYVEPANSEGAGDYLEDPDFLHLCQLVSKKLNIAVNAAAAAVISGWMSKHPIAHIESAIDASAVNEAKSVNYVTRVLEGRSTRDKKHGGRSTDYGPGGKARYEIPAEYADVVIG